MTDMFLLDVADDWDLNSYQLAVFTSIEKASEYLSARCGQSVAFEKSRHGGDFYWAHVDNLDVDGYGRGFCLHQIEVDPVGTPWPSANPLDEEFDVEATADKLKRIKKLINEGKVL